MNLYAPWEPWAARLFGGFFRWKSWNVLEVEMSTFLNIVQKPKWHSDALDIPDIFWNMPNYEPLYIMAAKIQDIKSRQNICPYFPFLHMSSVYFCFQSRLKALKSPLATVGKDPSLLRSCHLKPWVRKKHISDISYAHQTRQSNIYHHLVNANNVKKTSRYRRPGTHVWLPFGHSAGGFNPKKTVVPSMWFHQLINSSTRTWFMLVWLVVYLPLWKIWVRQLGWWHSQYMENKIHVPNHQPDITLW